MAKVVGIDLGTTNSVVAAIEGGQPSVIINAETIVVISETTISHITTVEWAN